MENNVGWVRLHRKLLDNPIFDKADYLRLWLYILLNVNHKDKSFIWNNQKITINRGSGIFSQKKISEKLGISLGTVNRVLNYFEKDAQIGKQTTNKYTVITVINWNKYQANGKQIENRLKTNGKQIETNNNDKNEKNDKKYTEAKLSLDEVAEKINEAFNVYLGRKFKGIDSFKNNLAYWLDTYQPKEIEEAIRNIKYDKFWRDKMTPTILFRRKNPQGEPVDYISQLLIKENDGYPR